MALERLPLETLQHVCAILQDDSRQSLLAFSLANRKCRAAAAPGIFQTVAIEVNSADDLAADVAMCQRHLANADAFRHVRTLRLEGWMETSNASYDRQLRTRNFYLGRKAFHPYEYRLEGSVPDSASAQRTRELDIHWKPLAELIEQLESLVELIYSCANQFSPCLLMALHSYHPQCKLHLHSFHLRSLCRLGSTPIDIDPYELELLSSACLYSIVLAPTNGFTPYELSSSDSDIVLELVQGLAPNLRKVSFLRAMRSPEAQADWERTKDRTQSWSYIRSQIFSEEILQSQQKGALTALELYRSEYWDYFRWDTILDLSQLQDLTIHYWTGLRSHRENITSCTTLNGLRSLHLPITFHAKEEFLIDIVNLLMRIPPLEVLETSVHPSLTANRRGLASHTAHKDMPQLLPSLLHHHGRVLRKLSLTVVENECIQDFLESHHVDLIADNCPLLEDLSIPILRSTGDAEEIATYKALGRLRMLKDIQLHLNCFAHAPRDNVCAVHVAPGIAHPFSFLENTDIRTLLVNYAVDQSLAKEIFDCISRAKKAHCAARLKSLHLHVINNVQQTATRWMANGVVRAALLTPETLEAVCWHIGRDWICTPSPRDDQPNEVVIAEFGKDVREFRETREPHNENERDDFWRSKHWSREEIEVVRQEIAKLWPPGPSGDWKDDWKSLPLHGGEYIPEKRWAGPDECHKCLRQLQDARS